jgi:hypothetical protein
MLGRQSLSTVCVSGGNKSFLLFSILKIFKFGAIPGTLFLNFVLHFLTRHTFIKYSPSG